MFLLVFVFKISRVKKKCSEVDFLWFFFWSNQITNCDKRWHTREFQRIVADKSQTQFLFIFGFVIAIAGRFYGDGSSSSNFNFIFRSYWSRVCYLKCGKNVFIELDYSWRLAEASWWKQFWRPITQRTDWRLTA